MEKDNFRRQINLISNLKDTGSDFQKEISTRMYVFRQIKNVVKYYGC